MTSAIEKFRSVSQALRKAGIEEADKEAEMFLSGCLGIDKVSLYRDNPLLTDRQREEVERIVNRRLAREPIQYITGRVEFCGLDISVGPGALIPRPETELIVEEVARTLSSQSLSRPAADRRPRFLDLCTGTGCLALALGKLFSHAEVVGTDISEKALVYARENAWRNDVANVTFLQGDLFEPVRSGRFDIIVTNPPYVKESDIPNLQPEIRDWEPRTALNGGEDGLFFYRRILSQAVHYLTDRGFIVMEIGEGESADVLTLAGIHGFSSAAAIPDYSGIQRVVRVSR